MDSSFSSNDSILVKSFEVDKTTELKYEQSGVSQRFSINGQRRNETLLVPGKLCITENRFGDYLEWKAVDCPSGPGSPFKPTFAEIHGSKGIGFHPGKDDETVEFLPDPMASEYKRPIKVELSEVRSFLTSSKDEREITFILIDGTTLNPFVFERGSRKNFTIALERSISISQSKDNKNMFMVGPLRTSETRSPSAFPSAVAELFPDQVHHMSSAWGLAKQFKNDPYNVACTAAAKFGQMALNGELREIPGKLFPGRNGAEELTQDGESVLRNGKPEERTSVASDGMEMDADCRTNEEGYEVIFKPEKPEIDLPRRPETFRGQPLSQEQWLNYLDNDGRVINMEEIRKIVFHGGVEPTIRKHVWPLLLGIFNSNSTYEERRQQFTEKTCSYNRIKMQWATITEDQEERFHAFRDHKSLIEKDVYRTDRTMDFFKGEDSKGTETLRNVLMTYMMYNFNLGYVQGMSDLLAPILMEIQDEILSFWLFAKFMERIHTNFEMSQEGMQRQLKDSFTLLQLVDPKLCAYLDACDASNMYFAFRWLLIWFKREFSYPDVLLLWESLWTELPGPNYQLFIGLAILVQFRSTVMGNTFGLSEILRHVNDFSMRIDLEATLSMAEGMYLQVLQVGEKLPNNVRRIVGLPEIEEPDKLVVVNGSDGSGGSGRSSALSRPVDAQCSSSGSSRNGLRAPSAPGLSSSPDAVALENQYELGVSQFM